jgi:MraZ protein
VARSAASADLIGPLAPATLEPPLVEAVVAKPPSREDNVWHGEPLQAAPPDLLEQPLTLCLWSEAGGRKRTRPSKSASNAGQLFVGTYVCELDEHKRLVMPQQASEQMGLPRHLYITPGPEQCLWMCDASALERLTDKLRADARRLYLAQTERVTIDRSGRIALPAALTPIICMRQDVVLLGVGDHFELWDTERLQRYVDQKAARLRK